MKWLPKTVSSFCAAVAAHPITTRFRARRGTANGEAARACSPGAGIWYAHLYPLHTAMPWAAIAGALILWSASLGQIDPNAINDYGLVAALPVTFYAALIVLTVSFVCVLNDQDAPLVLMLVHVLTLIVIIHATLAIVYDAPRYAWMYKHIGVVAYINNHHSVDPQVDIYHNWPGFFALNALFIELAGLRSALSYAAVAPLFFNLLYLPALLLIFRSATDERRLTWLSVWFFYLGNWIGQDYFAPQALAYFFYLIVLGICLAWFRAPLSTPVVTERSARVLKWGAAVVGKLGARTESGPVIEGASQPAQRASLMLLVILVFTAIAASHQLTPPVTIVSIAALVLFRQCSARGLPLLMIVIVGAWIGYLAVTYMHNTLAWFVASFYRLLDNLHMGIHELSQSSAGRNFVAQVARSLTLGMWLLAFAGNVRSIRARRWHLSMALLAAAPLVFVTQAYGGEMLLRVYLFGLPFVAYCVASLFYPIPMIRGKIMSDGVTSALTTITSCVLIAGLLFAHFGNERMNRVTPYEVDGVRQLYQYAEPGALILALNDDFPIKIEGYERYSHVFLEYQLDLQSQKYRLPTPETIVGLMEDRAYPAAYLIITRSQKEFAGLIWGKSTDELSAFDRALRSAPDLEIVFENRDVQIYTLAPREWEVHLCCVARGMRLKSFLPRLWL